MRRITSITLFLCLFQHLLLCGQSPQDSIFFLPLPGADSSSTSFFPSNNFSPFFYSNPFVLHSGNPSIPTRPAFLPDAPAPNDFLFYPLWNPNILNAVPRGFFSFRHPITLTQALVSSQKEQNFYLFLSRNISPKWNVFSELEFFRTPGIIPNSAFNSTRVNLAASGVSGKKNQFLYSINFSHNKNFGPQSGGISDSLDFLLGSGPAGNSNALLDVNFSNAFSRNLFTQVNLQSWCKVGGKELLDSLNPLRNFNSGSFLFAKLNAADAFSFFSQQNPDDDNALPPAFNPLGFNERTFLRNSSMSAGWLKRSGSPRGERLFKADFSYQHFFLSQNGWSEKFGFLSASTLVNFDFKKYGFENQTAYYFNGIRSGNSNFSLKTWINLKNSGFRIFTNVKLCRQLPDYRYFFFRGNQYYWENKILTTQSSSVSLGLDFLRTMALEFGYGAIRRLPRLNLDSDNIDFSGNITFLFSRIHFEKEFRSYFVNIDGCFQDVSDGGFQTGMPRTNLRFSNHYSFRLLSKKLKLSPGLDLQWFEGLRPYSYHAPTGLFAFRQGTSEQSGLVAGFFLGFSLQTFRATLRIDNALDRLLSPNPVWMIDGFPVQSRVIRLNIIWLFWD